MAQVALWFILIYQWRYHIEYQIQSYLFLNFQAVKEYIQKELAIFCVRSASRWFKGTW
jgi:hypothetical protein